MKASINVIIIKAFPYEIISFLLLINLSVFINSINLLISNFIFRVGCLGIDIQIKMVMNKIKTQLIL